MYSEFELTRQKCPVRSDRGRRLTIQICLVKNAEFRGFYIGNPGFRRFPVHTLLRKISKDLERSILRSVCTALTFWENLPVSRSLTEVLSVFPGSGSWLWGRRRGPDFRRRGFGRRPSGRCGTPAEGSPESGGGSGFYSKAAAAGSRKLMLRGPFGRAASCFCSSREKLGALSLAAFSASLTSTESFSEVRAAPAVAAICRV